VRYALGSYDLAHRRFDDGNVLFRRSAADSAPAITWPSLVNGTPPPIAEYLPPETGEEG